MHDELDEHSKPLDRWIKLYVVFTPVLWGLGVLLPAAIALLLWLLLQNRPSILVRDRVVISWLLVAAMQALALLVNWLYSGYPATFLVRELLGTTTRGWLILAAVLAVGRYSNLRSETLIRAASILGLYIIVFALVAYGVYFIAGRDIYLRPSLLAYLLPAYIPPQSFHFTVSLATLAPGESLFGLEFPRLVLFYPWPLILGFAGIGIFFMTIHENSNLWKLVGMTGALLAIIGSLGRISIVAFMAAGLLFIWVKSTSPYKWLLLPFSAVLIILAVLVLNIDVMDLFSRVSKRFLESRPYSTELRMEVNQETWDAVVKSPILGSPQQLVKSDAAMPIGSHSTILGLLYSGGFSTFAFFGLAVLLTTGELVKRCLQGDPRHISALTIFFALMLFTYTESIHFFVFPTMLVFLWIGWALSPLDQHAVDDISTD